jgi:anti-sigma regulatory factor (Ser/Thr protein kinase)
VPSARQHARHVVTEWGYTQIAGTAELVVSEIVTNAVRHAHQAATEIGVPPVRLRLTDWLSGVQIEVRDGSSRMPRAEQQAAPDPEAGRGLLLVGALSDCWGAYPTQDGGKVVFAVISA